MNNCVENLILNSPQESGVMSTSVDLHKVLNKGKIIVNDYLCAVFDSNSKLIATYEHLGEVKPYEWNSVKYFEVSFYELDEIPDECFIDSSFNRFEDILERDLYKQDEYELIVQDINIK